jgi:hypothetical protein
MQDVVARMVPIRPEAEAMEAMGYLQEDFGEIDSIGPKRVAAFLGRDGDEGFQADVRGLVLDFVDACQKQPT